MRNGSTRCHLCPAAWEQWPAREVGTRTGSHRGNRLPCGLRQLPSQRVKASDKVTLRGRANAGAEARGELDPAVHGWGWSFCLDPEDRGDPGVLEALEVPRQHLT